MKPRKRIDPRGHVEEQSQACVRCRACKDVRLKLSDWVERCPKAEPVDEKAAAI
jgi:hypothetical protein